jgi:hypothetical protein
MKLSWQTMTVRPGQSVLVIQNVEGVISGVGRAITYSRIVNC